MPNDDDFNLTDDLDTLSLDDFSLDEDFSITQDAAPDEPGFEGVFVKTAPEDIPEEGEEPLRSWNEDSPELEEFSLDDVPAAAPVSEPVADFSADFGDDALSSEELDKIGSDFDLVEAESPPEQEEAGGFDEISLDDFVSFDDDSDPSGGLKEESVQADAEIPSESESKEEFLDIDISIEDEIDDHELEIVEGAKVKKASFETAAVSGAEEVDLSEFADLSDSGLEDSTSFGGIEVETMEEGFFEEGTFDLDSEVPSEPEEAPEPEVTPDIQAGEAPLADLSDEDLMLDAPETEEISDEGENEPFFEVGQEADFSDDFETVLSQEKDQGYDITVEPEEPDMDAIQALEDDLTSGLKKDPALGGTAAESILLKIEKELLSIKEEISSLKNEVTQLKTLPGQESPAASQEKDRGFFTDDEDEVIALTGDELDNILSSAEITEEAVEGGDDQVSGTADQDIIPYDEDGNILPQDSMDFADPDESQSDVDLFAGTELEESLEDDIHVPETGLTGPIPGAMDLDSPDSIPSDLDLEPLGVDESQDILGSGKEEFSEIGTLDISESDSDEVSFELEDQDAGSFLEGSAQEEDLLSEESTLEIPLDEDFIGDDDQLAEIPLEEEDRATAASEEAPSLPQMTEEISSEPEEMPPEAPASAEGRVLTESLREEIKTVLSYMDKLLENLPDDKIKEFADSEHFEVYKRLFEELGLTD